MTIIKFKVNNRNFGFRGKSFKELFSLKILKYNEK